MTLTMSFGNISLAGDDHIFATLSGWKTTSTANGRFISTIPVFGFALKSDLITKEAEIDQIINKINRYNSDQFEQEPTWLEIHADTESPKRAFVYSAEYKHASAYPISPLLKFPATKGVLVVEHGFWESVTKTTAINAQVMDWTSNHAEINNTPGSISARINSLIVKGQPTNDESNPLVSGWIGIRPEYQGYGEIDFKWEFEDGTLGTDATLGSEAHPAVSPFGSSTDNKVEVDFGTTEPFTKRWNATLADCIVGANSVTNGDAEFGNMSGWNATFFSASTNSPISGTYSFYIDENDGAASMEQTVSVIDESYYLFSMKWLLYATVWDGSDINVTLTYNNGNGEALSFERVSSSTQGIERFVIGPVPAGTTQITINILGFADPLGGSVRLDDIKLQNWPVRDWIGEYLVLCRSKVSAGTEANIKLKYGMRGSTIKQDNLPVKIANTDWLLHPVGSVKFPLHKIYSGYDYELMEQIELEIHAERTNGAGNLELDALLFIPANGLLSFTDVAITSFETEVGLYIYSNIEVKTSPENTIISIMNNGNILELESNRTILTNGFQIESGNTVMVGAFQTESVHNLNDDFEITLEIYPRWLTRNDT